MGGGREREGRKEKKVKQTESRQTHSPFSANIYSEAGRKAQETLWMRRAGVTGSGLGPGAALSVKVLLSQRPWPKHQVCTQCHIVLQRSGTQGMWPRENIRCYGRWNCSFFKDVPRGRAGSAEAPGETHSKPWHLDVAPLTGGWLLSRGKVQNAPPRPQSLEAAFPSRHGADWHSRSRLCFGMLELTHYNLKQSLGTKRRINLLHSENAKWHLPTAAAGLQLVLGEMCHGKSTGDHRHQFLSLAFNGSFGMQWFFIFIFYYS